MLAELISILQICTVVDLFAGSGRVAHCSVYFFVTLADCVRFAFTPSTVYTTIILVSIRSSVADLLVPMLAGA